MIQGGGTTGEGLDLIRSPQDSSHFLYLQVSCGSWNLLVERHDVRRCARTYWVDEPCTLLYDANMTDLISILSTNN